MSDDEIRHEVTEKASEGSDRGSTRFSPEDALAMFSRQLDSALGRHKKELFDEIDIKIGASQSKEKSTHVHQQKFKFEGNSRQHEFNSERLDEIEKVRSFIERGSASAALKVLDKTEKSIKERNKMIRIADKYGWDVVEEFMDDPLTDNAEEATRLKQAEYRAKTKRKEKASQNNRFIPYTKPTEKAATDLFRRPSGTYQEESPKGKPYSSDRNVYSSSEYFGGRKGETRCYYCNAEGHWAYQCPRKAAKFPTGKQQ